jgi:hypothetical protein
MIATSSNRAVEDTMKRSKLLVGLLGLLFGFVAAAAGRIGWRTLSGRLAQALPGGDERPASLPAPGAGGSTAVPAAAAETAAAGSAGAAPQAATEASTAEDEAPGGGEVDETIATAGEAPAPVLAEGEDVAFVEARPSPAEAAGELAEDQATAAEVDAVLATQAAAEAAHEPPAVQSRFGPTAFPADAGGDCPPEHPVKGNASSMIYHLPGQPSYGATMADACFADAEAAEAAGFRARKTVGGQARE